MAGNSSLWNAKLLYKLFTIWALIWATVLGSSTIASGDKGPKQGPGFAGDRLETYSQRVIIAFTDEAAAEQAQVAIEPLYDGYHRAVSCRWDDNWTSDNPGTRDVMEELGIRGTWYLNGRHFYPGGQPADYLPVARELLKGGNSIGGHSLTHPYLTYYLSNRMFAEISGVRIDWEAALDRPVLSYAYSFVDLRPEPEGKAVLERSLKTLRRAGFYHIAEYLSFFDDIALDLELSPIMPPENNPLEVFRNSVNWAYADEGSMELWPMISNSMHAWYATERLNYGYDELRARLGLLAKLKDVWHCNQNEYAAYRRQFRSVQLSPIDYSGREITFELRNRPELLSLDDATPLTISVTGVHPSKIVDAHCPSASLLSSNRSFANLQLYHVAHDRNQRLPKKIGHISNVENTREIGGQDLDPDFPMIRGNLSVVNDQLSLQVANDSDHPLENIRIRWRAPIGWQIEKSEAAPHHVAKGEKFAVSITLSPSEDEQERLGQAHFAAQLDFDSNDEACRIHFTCQRPGDLPNDTWPINGFSLLGPIVNEQFNASEFIQQVEQDGCPKQWKLPNGTTLNWRANARDGYLNHDWLNPEYVRTMGTWDALSPTYVLRSKLFSPTAQNAKIVVSHAHRTDVLLNGTRVNEAGQCKLIEGENDLVIVYPGVAMSYETPRLAACFVRIADPATDKRLQNIRYHAH